MSPDSTRVRIQSLTPALVERLGAPTDALLRRARADLVPLGAHLETAWERAVDAEHDRTRFVLVAVRGHQALGIVDAAVLAGIEGEGHVLRIAQLAVVRTARRRGVALRLLRACLRRAEVAVGNIGRLHASVLPGRDGAEGFWTALGFEAERDPRELSAPTAVLRSGRLD